MKHNIMITVDGISFEATAHTGPSHGAQYTPRMVTHVTVDNVPLQVRAIIDERSALLDVDDILEVVRHYLNDPMNTTHEFDSRDVEISWLVFDYQAIRDDIMAHSTYIVHVELSSGRVVHEEVGANSGIAAWGAVSWLFNPDEVVRHSSTQPA